MACLRGRGGSPLRAAERQHAAERVVAIDEVVLQRAADMGDEHEKQEPEQINVDGAERIRQPGILFHQRRQIELLEILQREAVGGVERPARQRDRRDKQVEEAVHGFRGEVLPAGRRDVGGPPVDGAPEHAKQEQARAR